MPKGIENGTLLLGGPPCGNRSGISDRIADLVEHWRSERECRETLVDILDDFFFGELAKRRFIPSARRLWED
ncbi:MAG: hypothetical protein C4334_13510 [Pyrinomonas sp.]